MTFNRLLIKKVSRGALLATVSVLAALVMAGCQDADCEPCRGAPVATVVVTPAELTLTLGTAQQVTVQTLTARGAALSGRLLTWTSSDEATATVSADGLVTAIAPGTATITATSEGRSGSVIVTVTLAPVDTVTITLAEVSLTVTGTQQLTAELKAADGTALADRTIAWTSSDEASATVSVDGMVTAIAPGTATITATSEGKTGTVTVTVTLAPVDTVTITPADVSLTENDTQQLTAELKAANGTALTNRTITWSSSNNAIATVSTSGLVTAIAPGTATITATSEGKSAP